MGEDLEQRYRLALLELGERLEAIRVSYDSADAIGPRENLWTVFNTVKSLHEFLCQIGWHKQAFALDKLIYALTDIEAGAKIDWLTPPTERGEALLPVETAAWRGRLAWKMTKEMETGITRDEAARRVWKTVTADNPAFAGIKNPTHKTIINWRNDAIGYSNSRIADAYRIARECDPESK